MAYDLLSIYPAKLMEYGLGVGYMLLFIPFWKYVQGGKPAEATVPAHAPAMAREKAVRAPAAAAPAFGWFNIPAGLKLHPGHTWARVETDGVVTVGMDDFAQKLVGRPDSIELPPVGTHVAQGEKAWSLVVDSMSVPMLSPVDGEVVEVNPEVLRSPEILRRDPYGDGWLFKVRSHRMAADTTNLLSGRLARAWMENALDKLRPIEHESLGPVLADGGLPIEGLARALGGERWAELARTHLLTDEE